jgi:2-succinyl-6-hydroxy-2,4-cyclohexadiene-1-carboxylate synthase
MTKLTYFADPDTGLPPLLMVHGILVSHRTWDPNAELAQSFRRIRVDLPGHGASPALTQAEAAHPDALLRDLDAVRQSLGLPRWHLCGQSFGAALVLRYALEFPDQTGGVIFTNANAALRQVWTEEAALASNSLVAQIRSEGHAAIRRMPFHPAKARHFDPAIRALLSAEADRVDPASIAFLQQEAIPRLSVRDRLDALRVPVLLTNGLRERRFQAARDWLGQAHPAIRIKDLPGGHSINVESATAFNEAATAFLRPLAV